MLGVIQRREAYEKALAKYPDIHELYADPDFTMEQDTNVNFYVLHGDSKDTCNIHMDFNDIISCRCYITSNPFNSFLQGKKIIWRDGKWYV